jgi:hypothetical protein
LGLSNITGGFHPPYKTFWLRLQLERVPECFAKLKRLRLA